MLDLSSLNRFVPHVHFQMEGLHCLMGLHDKYRSKRHIFFCSNSQILSKVSSFHLGHKTLDLSGSPFRSQFSTPNIHQPPETCCRLPEKAGVSHNNLFRRLPSSCLLQREVLRLRWLNTVLRAVSGNSRNGECFNLDKHTWRRKSNGTEKTISQNLLIKIL